MLRVAHLLTALLAFTPLAANSASAITASLAEKPASGLFGVFEHRVGIDALASADRIEEKRSLLYDFASDFPVAARGTGTVLVDSNAVVQLGKDATLGGRLLDGERGVISYVTRPELRNAVAAGSLRGVPRALESLDVLTQRPSIDAIINFRGGLLRSHGRFGDGIIGAQAVEFRIPLITNDAELASAVRAAGGTVR